MLGDREKAETASGATDLGPDPFALRATAGAQTGEGDDRNIVVGFEHGSRSVAARARPVNRHLQRGSRGYRRAEFLGCDRQRRLERFA